MSETVYKAKKPFKQDGKHYYPITTHDQIIMPDGNRWDGQHLSSDVRDDAVEVGSIKVNADLLGGKLPEYYKNATTLGGVAASEYALKTKTVPTSRTVNGKALSENITLSASDVKARNETWLPSTDNLKSIQMASWNGNTEPSGLPAGITHVSVSGSGKDAGFPVGYATCVAVNLDPSRCIQLLVEKTNGKLWTRSGTDSSSWGSWQSYLPALQMYPVGSIYMSVNSTSPASLFGGTWEQIKGRFLIGTGAPENNDDGASPGDYNIAPESTGGEAEHAHTLASAYACTCISGNALHYSYRNNTLAVFTPQWKGVFEITEASTSDQNYPADIGGQTDEESNMPPYLAVYMWKRVS